MKKFVAKVGEFVLGTVIFVLMFGGLATMVAVGVIFLVGGVVSAVGAILGADAIVEGYWSLYEVWGGYVLGGSFLSGLALTAWVSVFRPADPSKPSGGPSTD